MKNVWILNHYAQEPSAAGGTRHFNFAYHLRDHNWNAFVIAASVNHASGEQRLSIIEDKRFEAINGVSFLWVKTPDYRGNGTGRMRNMLSYALRVLFPKVTVDLPLPDVVVGSSVHPFAAIAGALLARRHRVPFIFEVRDLWPQTLIDMGRIKSSSFLAWILRKIELWLYKRSSRIVVLLPNAWEYIVPLGIARNKIVWIANGVDLNSSPLPADSVDSGVFTLMYFGSHGQANDLINVLKAMKLVQDSGCDLRIVLRLVGDGPLKATLIGQASDLALNNVFFEPSVPKSEIPNLAAKADAFVLSVLDLPNLYRYGISMNKLYDYLAASRPVIIASNAVNNPVEDANAGLAVAANDPEALAQAICKIAATPLEQRNRMGRAGRSYVLQYHDFSILSSKLASVFDQVLVEENDK